MTWLKTWEGFVEKNWLDSLDHVNFLTYQRIADIASFEVWRRAKSGAESDLQFVITETHVRYLRELRLGELVQIRTSLLAFDSKRFQLLHHLESGGNLSCTVETLNLCFDTASRRATPFTEEMTAYFASWGPPPINAVAHLIIGRRPSLRSSGD
ncbi:acyl-CoA thioesterase [Phyllobacterium endophyticum]|uniref:acyl-CoA thioesterase n=1 Tax=Phyllobacterium endophyticum TaxID=1149773 RepID=UPI0011CC95EE|nr:thioesterase family protein [Phyllobacterium endophyticum]TXR50535.1 acyl-CoA thioesterase [Phyllobacterium endophyticum]